jgi:hypothetical protein
MPVESRIALMIVNCRDRTGQVVSALTRGARPAVRRALNRFELTVVNAPNLRGA